MKIATHFPFGILVCTVVLAAPADAVIRYAADKNHSTVGFNVPIMGLAKVTGKFTEFEMAIAYDEKEPQKSTVKVRIQAASVNTGIADRDAHLRRPDFFDAEQYPEITFESTRMEIKRDGSGVAYGVFTLRGVKKEMALPFQLTLKTYPDSDVPILGIRATAKINRREFGMNWQHNAVPDFVPDEIELDLAIVTRRGKRE